MLTSIVRYAPTSDGPKLPLMKFHRSSLGWLSSSGADTTNERLWLDGPVSATTAAPPSNVDGCGTGVTVIVELSITRRIVYVPSSTPPVLPDTTNVPPTSATLNWPRMRL